MRYDLRTLTRRQNPNIRRRRITFRDIVPPATLASDLYLACYRPIVQLWERAAPRIAAEYERSLSQLTTDTADDVQARIGEVEGEFSRLFLELEAALRDWALRTERWQRGKWRRAVLSATGVDVNTLIGPEDVRATLDTYIRWNTALIRDVSDQARKRISDAVYSGLNERRPARDVARQIREATGMARDRSVRIASDQLSKISSSLAAERRREAGLDSWEWKHSRKAHPRADHQARDGKVYTDQSAPADKPGQLPYCGCRELAVLDLD